MPEAAMNEYGHLARGQHDIGRARQISAMQAEAKAKTVERPPHDYLRVAVLLGNGAHGL